MKLEGLDPEHPSRFCVLTVAEVGDIPIFDSKNPVYIYGIYVQVKSGKRSILF